MNDGTRGEPPTHPRANAPAMGTSRVIVVLAKAPVAGRAKTRLTPPATPQGAATIAAAALLDTLDAARAVPGAGVLVALEGGLADAERGEEIASSLEHVTVVAQRGESLGQRIAAAHADAARLAPGAHTVQIGMDSPQVDADLLTDALDLVAGDADAALGLAHDGGWWALALSDPRHAEVIVDVPTSRDDTGRATLAALRAGHPGLRPGRVLELPPLSDVDTAVDALAVSDLVPHGRFAHAVRDLLPVPGGLPR